MDKDKPTEPTKQEDPKTAEEQPKQPPKAITLEVQNLTIDASTLFNRSK